MESRRKKRAWRKVARRIDKQLGKCAEDRAIAYHYLGLESVSGSPDKSAASIYDCDSSRALLAKSPSSGERISMLSAKIINNLAATLKGIWKSEGLAPPSKKALHISVARHPGLLKRFMKKILIERF